MAEEEGDHPGILRGGNLHGSRGQGGAAKYKYCDFNRGSAAGSQLHTVTEEEEEEFMCGFRLKYCCFQTLFQSWQHHLVPRSPWLDFKPRCTVHVLGCRGAKGV